MLAIKGGKPSIKTPMPHWHWPTTSQEDTDAVVAELTQGKNNAAGYPKAVENFERAFAKYHSTKHALLLNSGTSAIHSAFWALGVGPSDEVIAPVFTFFATATPIKQLGAKPVLCDCLPDTACIDPEQIQKKITPKTKAVIITHLWGHPCELNEITAICKKRGLPLIEDCSHAHGATYRGQKVGTFGDIACFSLGSQKMLAAGEAGMMITDNRRLFEKALLLGDFGGRLKSELTLPETKVYQDTGMGCKYRVNSLGAALGYSRFKRLDTMIEERQSTLNYLSKQLEGIPGIRPPVTKDYVTRGGFFGYKPWYISEELGGLSRERYLEVLRAEGMDIRATVTPPLHQLPFFKDSRGGFPAADLFFESTLSLPTFSLKTERPVIDEYVSAFKKVAAERETSHG